LQYSGESFFNNPEKFDIMLGPTVKRDNYIPFILGYHYILVHNIDISIFTTKRLLNKPKDKFCIFTVSNPRCEQRNKFFHKLSKYKFIHSCGKAFNNTTCPGDNFWYKEYIDFISGFKFMICFENSSADYYFTEKCINAFLGGAIPIYWGCPQTSEFINMDSILYLPPNYTEKDEEELIAKIIELDNNDELYRQTYEQTFFNMINSKLPDIFNLQVIKSNIQTVLSNI
jgi:hypothetical protein